MERASFTLGASREKVIAVLGVPDAEGKGSLRYGQSVVFLQNGRISGWIDSGDPSLPVILRPGEPTPRPDCIAPGDPVDGVLALLGTPTAIIKDRWYFGPCLVVVKERRVISFTEEACAPIPRCP